MNSGSLLIRFTKLGRLLLATALSRLAFQWKTGSLFGRWRPEGLSDWEIHEIVRCTGEKGVFSESEGV